MSTISIKDLADRTIGVHSKIYALGNSVGSISVPGVGLPETETDYRIIAVLDRLMTVAEDDLDSFVEDNAVPVSGTYRMANGDLAITEPTDKTRSLSTLLERMCS